MNDRDFILELEDRITTLENNLTKTVVEGVVHEVQAKPYRVIINYGTVEKEQLTAWLPVAIERSATAAIWWPLEVGEGVTILSPNGNLSRGRVMRGRYTTDYPAISDNLDLFKVNFGDAGFIEYDRKEHALKGILPDGATTDLVSTGGIRAVGDLHVTGNITATKEITDHTRSMQADRDISNAHDHDVQNHSKAIPTEDW